LVDLLILKLHVLVEEGYA